MKILITGGHYTPALAVISQLKNHEIVFVGRKYSIESDSTESPEYKEVKARGIKFIHLNTGKINRFFSLGSLLNLLRVFSGLKQAKEIIEKERPAVVLSFGSYIGVPIAFQAWRKKIPVYTHEQTIRPGLSNRLISIIAKKVFISFDKSRRYFPVFKTLLTGNPLRESVLSYKGDTLNIKTKRKVIFITGGSLGSHSINILVKGILKRLLDRYYVIHQTGSVKEFSDYNNLISYKKRLPLRFKHNYMVREHFSERQIGYIYSKADLLVSRAGANTVFEIIALKKPSVLIPLPWSANKEQEKQAQFLQASGVAEIFYQNQNPLKLLTIIEEVINKINHYQNNFNKVLFLNKKNAAEKIAKEILDN